MKHITNLSKPLFLQNDLGPAKFETMPLIEVFRKLILLFTITTENM